MVHRDSVEGQKCWWRVLRVSLVQESFSLNNIGCGWDISTVQDLST